MTAVKLNSPVPDFVAQATNQKDIVLSRLKGWNCVFYFYPKDNTPGCTTEGLDFKDFYTDFLKANTLVFGVSKDTLKSHEQFKTQHEFPFELISDTDAYLCRLFEVIKPLNLQGKQIQGVERSTFLLDAEGYLRHEWRKVRVNGHVEEVLEAAEKLTNPATTQAQP